jgi:hypothetical protein
MIMPSQSASRCHGTHKTNKKPQDHRSETLHQTLSVYQQKRASGSLNRANLWDRTASRTPPPRRWRCQSSGRVMVSCCGCAAIAVALRFGRWERLKRTRQGNDGRRTKTGYGFGCACADRVVAVTATRIAFHFRYSFRLSSSGGRARRVGVWGLRACAEARSSKRRGFGLLG